jgi:hypothetical protein
MTRKSLGETFDNGVSSIAERLSRRLSRRAALKTAVVGSATGIAALTLGQLPAQAVTFDCGPTRRCSGCAGGCPSGYSLCKGSSTSNCFNNQGFRCEWPSGYWVAASGFGKCNEGFYLCYDCKGSSGCPGWCTCLSNLICGPCCTPTDLQQEWKRIQQALANA